MDLTVRIKTRIEWQPCITWSPFNWNIIKLFKIKINTNVNYISLFKKLIYVNKYYIDLNDQINVVLLALVRFTRCIGLNHMIHSWDNPPSISLSFKLAFVVPRRCIYALTSIKTEIIIYHSNQIHIGQGINYWGNKSHSILIL